MTPKKVEQLKQKPQIPIGQAGKDDHKSEQWKTRKCIQTGLSEIPYSPLNIKNKVNYKNKQIVHSLVTYKIPTKFI